jgi:hypothetical protein
VTLKLCQAHYSTACHSGSSEVAMQHSHASVLATPSPANCPENAMLHAACMPYTVRLWWCAYREGGNLSPGRSQQPLQLSVALLCLPQLTVRPATPAAQHSHDHKRDLQMG